jgi:hypothetical protein
MKCFTYFKGRIETGIQVDDDDVLGQVVKLGDKSSFVKVPLSAQRLPLMKDGRLIQASPTFRINQSGKTCYLERATYTTSQYLVRINTKGVGVVNGFGTWHAVGRDIEQLATITMSYGWKEYPSRWTDSLVLMSPGNVVRVKPEGCREGKHIALIYNSHLICQPFEDWQMEKGAWK